MPTVYIAGATGYLGQSLVKEFSRGGWTVRALVRNANRARELGIDADDLIEAEATQPSGLVDTMAGVDLVVSALGITRQRDGLTYWDVDFQANANLLAEAQRAGVGQFAYIHVLGGDKMRQVPLVAAKQAFVDLLQAAPIVSTVVAPSGYFSDMADFLAMARSGRVWLFGDGSLKLNPIDGRDLAKATVQAVTDKRSWLDIGGPDILSHRQIGELAFSAVGQPVKVTYLPDWLRRAALRIVAWVTPRHISGPARFFLTALGQDMVGEPHGTHHLKEHFHRLAQAPEGGQ